MIEGGYQGVAEPMSSSGVRNAILSQHDVLRGLLAEAIHLAVPKARSRSELEALRARVRTLYLTLEEHLTFEAQAFPHALRDVIGWGAVLQDEIAESHARQRQALATALAALEPETLSWVELTRNVRAFATSLMRDIETEEEALLDADLDAIATDGAGG
jgi:hypothetical protein